MDYRKLRAQLTEHEGIRLSAYPDSRGLLTIGIGRMIDKKEGGGISLDEAQYLLENDIRGTEEKVRKALPYWRDLDDVRQRVLVDMAFNMGIGRLMEFRKTLALIEAKDFVEASEEMLRSDWAEQTGRRAIRLAEMMKTGQDVPPR